MTPAELDVEVIARRLRLMRETLADLRPLTELGPDALGSDPIRRAAAERFVQVLIDQAGDINAHVALACLGSAPTTTAASFLMAAEAGALPPELAQRLAPSAGLRNLLVHRYGEIDVAMLARSASALVQDLDDYLGHVARWLKARA